MRMVRAGALLYSVFVSFVAALFCGFYIMVSFYQNRLTDIQINITHLPDLARSAAILSLYNNETPESGQEMELFADQGKVMVSTKQWGAYKIIVATAFWKCYDNNVILMAGADYLAGEQIALYLPDNRNYLSLCGKTIINGDCYLPELGAKRAYIEGKSYSGKELIYGEVKQSARNLPEANEDIISFANFYTENSDFEQDSMRYFEEFQNKDTISNSFKNRTLVVYSTDDIRLDYKTIYGNVIIVSSGEIKISSGTIVADAIFAAERIIVENGFEGKLQLFAARSLIIEKDCRLLYPSFLCLLRNNEGDKEDMFLIGEKCLIEGGALLIDNAQGSKSPLKLSIEENAEVYGQVYSNSFTELKGKIRGSLYTNGFLLKTTSSVYENHLLDAEIDAKNISQYFASADITGESIKQKRIKWLY